MKSNKLFWVISIIMVLSLVLAACGPTTETPVVEEPAADEPVAEEPVASTGERAPVIRLASLSDMTSTNVWNLYDDAGASYWNYAVQGGHWPALYGLSDVRWDYIPSLADGFPSEVTQEGEVWTATVTMKQGPVWSDGTPVTANDVAFTANTALLFGLGLNWLGAYNPDYVAAVEAVDDYTVRYTFSAQPGLPVWQYGVLLGPIVNQAYWEPLIADLVARYQALDANAADYEDQRSAIITELEALPNGPLEGEPTFGAFRLNNWEVGAFAETVLNPANIFIGTVVEEYANGAYREVAPDGTEFVAYGEATGDTTLAYTSGPYFDSALYSLYDNDTAVLALRNNDVDFILNPSGLSVGYVQQLQEDPNISIIQNAQNGFRYMAFNFNRPFFAGEPGNALRQAIACMIDLDFLTGRVLQGQVVPVYTLVPEGLTSWFNPEVPVYCAGLTTQERLVEAVRILTDAGFTWEVEPSWMEDRGGSVNYGEGLVLPDGTVFPEITVLAPNAGYDPLRATAGVYIEQWMRQLGIPATAELTNFNNILDAVYTTGDYDAFLLGWGLSAFPSYLCDFFGGGVGADNSYGYDSAELQTLCTEFYTEPDFATAQGIVDQIQVVLATDLPYITLFTNPIYDAYRNLNYPYTQTFDGLGAGLYGAPALAMPAAAQ